MDRWSAIAPKRLSEPTSKMGSHDPCFRRDFLRITLTGVVATVCGGVTARAANLQDERFKREVIAILGHRHPGCSVLPIVDPMMVVLGDMKISLDNIFLTVRDMEGDERENAIVDFFENAVSNNPHNASSTSIPYSTAKTRLLLQIVPEEFVQTAPDLLLRPFFSGLSIAYVLDRDGSYELMQKPVLGAWGVGQEVIEAQAMANLETHSQSQELEPRRGEEGAFVTVATEDSYSAAQLLLPGFMARLRNALKTPRVFVGIPNRDFLVAWTPDFSGRRAFAEKIRQDAANEPYPLTEDLFVSTETGVSLMSVGEMRDHGR
ncbi:DUF1444 family protein [Rhizobium sp. RCAM05350]|nr:DUF1444 family protein [Rhizobium sp. RCAM05350]